MERTEINEALIIGEKKGKVSWQSPSNIALVKYWGKYGRQLPRNPSISFTLSQAYSHTTVDYSFIKHKETPSWSFTFEGAPKPAFEDRILKYLESINDVFPIVNRLNLKIDSHNTFPHSSGIASSASSMSALALCLADIERVLLGKADLDMRQASYLARLGSGSASRSVYGPLAIWGAHKISTLAHNEYAIPYNENIAMVFQDYHDDILIVSKSEKSVSSTAGHALMDGNPYAQNRFDQAHRHLQELILAMQKGDLDKFIEIVEQEALTLHALMMASNPPYMLMEPNTLVIINKIQDFRKDSQVPVCFTLDAGPNIHLLYPHAYAKQVSTLKATLTDYCADGLIIEDQVGLGPIKID